MKRIAILGGGVGAISAAFELTSGPDAYDVTIYQTGWRLGGKCASGRNAAHGHRIEEHGLHVWAGFYENAIALMRRCYEDLDGEDGVFPGFDAAFTPHNNVVLGDDTPDGWGFWPLRPAMAPKRGSVGYGAVRPWTYIRLVAETLRDVTEDALAAPFICPVEDCGADTPGPVRGVTDLMAETAARGERGETRATLATLVTQHQDAVAEGRCDLIERQYFDPVFQRIYGVLDLGGAILRGLLSEEVIRGGFDAIEDREFSDWIAEHGAHPDTVDSALVRAVYDYAFGYRDGICDRAHRAIGAGTFIQGTLRLVLTYRDAIFLKMNAGMGDTMFTPYYKALRKRGVKFRFFHEVTALRLDPAGRLVERIEIDRQATPKGAYAPFVRVGDLDCWPSQPLFDQLEEGEALKAASVDLEDPWRAWGPVGKVILERGADFDAVILGISLGALPAVAADLIAQSPLWSRMVRRVETVGTQAMQLWHVPKDLGWRHGDSILTAYADNMNTWADMSHLVAREAWPEGSAPGAISYFCGPTPDPGDMPDGPAADYARTLGDRMRERSRLWIQKAGAGIFPQVMTAGRMDPDRLIPPGDAEDALTGQYFRMNVAPSERYVMSTPGSAAARLRSDRSGFDNLWLAGDWTWTAINAGCVEAATMSGIRAAQALAGQPVRIFGEAADPRIGAIRTPVIPAPRTIRPQNSAWPWSAAFGMAKTTGAALMLPVPRDTVAALLPRGLEPGAQPVTGPAEHPVILLMGRQRNVRPNIAPLGMNYLEFICAVPWVRHSEPKLAHLGPLVTPTRLYLDSLPPILLGIYGYGFPKVRAEMLADATSYTIRHATGGHAILTAEFTPAGPEGRAVDFPLFATARNGFEMMMVTRNRLNMWQYSVYDFALAQARLTPADLSLRICSDDLGLPRGYFCPPSIADAPCGAFLLRTDATINNPLQSFDLLATLKKGPA
ncbi:NAD(P)-binding protein [Palleronia rufa]|uniref:NAD(P)-binding protein n=1 Tax=Palleronia rufa TaxID=1530186 RepID=UPI000561792C|nr:NAD(P)-binding protein [Palleronia rufa]